MTFPDHTWALQDLVSPLGPGGSACKITIFLFPGVSNSAGEDGGRLFSPPPINDATAGKIAAATVAGWGGGGGSVLPGSISVGKTRGLCQAVSLTSQWREQVTWPDYIIHSCIHLLIWYSSIEHSRPKSWIWVLDFNRIVDLGRSPKESSHDGERIGNHVSGWSQNRIQHLVPRTEVEKDCAKFWTSRRRKSEQVLFLAGKLQDKIFPWKQGIHTPWRKSAQDWTIRHWSLWYSSWVVQGSQGKGLPSISYFRILGFIFNSTWAHLSPGIRVDCSCVWVDFINNNRT